MILDFRRRISSLIRRCIRPVKTSASELRSASISLVVLVDEHCHSLAGLLAELKTARAAETKVDLALVLPAGHSHATVLRTQAAETNLLVHFFEAAEPYDLQKTYLAALRSLRGTWVGHTSVSAGFSPRHFPKLRAAIRSSARSTAAYTVSLELREHKYKRLDAGVEPAAYVLNEEGWRFPFIDLFNAYVSRQILCGRNCQFFEGSDQMTSGWSLRALGEYFSATGAKILHVKEVSKSLTNAALFDRFHPLGLGAEAMANRNRRACGDELTDISRYIATVENPPRWLQVRVAIVASRCMAALREVGEICDSAEQQHIEAALATIAKAVSAELWASRRLLPVPADLRVATVSRLAGIAADNPLVRIDHYDPVSELIRICWIEAEHQPSCLCRNQAPAMFAYFSSRERRAFGSVGYWEHVGWLPATGLGALSFQLEGREIPIEISGKAHRIVNGAHIEALLPTARKPDDNSIRVRLLRQLASSKRARQHFKDAWLFIDKDDRADDNAEHLYRHLQSHPKLRRRCFFILRKSSADWQRLKRAGFALLPFGGVLHKLALLNAAWLFSSHAAPFVLHLLPNKQFGDMLRFKFCFLQHGVTKDDQSAWLNSRNIDLLVTAGRPEFESMIEEPYKYTAREVVLTGFPRYDALLARKSDSPKTVVIMPTWRKSVAGKLLPGSSQRELNPEFQNSRFFVEWRKVLCNVSLFHALRERGLSVVFIPHPNLAPYVACFKLPAEIEVGPAAGKSIQDHLADCALLVTDYSSIAFDVAYLRRPVAYFQFDAEEFFESHTYSKGYFDYHLHGFGPVLSSAEQVCSMIEEVSRDEIILQPGFRKRIDEFFPHQDTDNSLRVVEAALERSQVYVGALRCLEATTQNLRSHPSIQLPQLSILRTGTE